MKNWYYVNPENETSVGPLTIGELINVISLNNLVWRESSLQEWVEAENHPELQDFIEIIKKNDQNKLTKEDSKTNESTKYESIDINEEIHENKFKNESNSVDSEFNTKDKAKSKLLKSGYIFLINIIGYFAITVAHFGLFNGVIIIEPDTVHVTIFIVEILGILIVSLLFFKSKIALKKWENSSEGQMGLLEKPEILLITSKLGLIPILLVILSILFLQL